MLSIIKRLLSDATKSKKLYFIWFLLLFLMVLLYGVLPVSSNIVHKIDLKNQMIEINNNLNSNASKLNQLQKDYEQAQQYIPFLNKYLPEDADIQNYLVDFTSTLNGTGFSLDRFVIVNKKTLDIDVYIFGIGDENNVIENIEKLKRVTVIKDFSITYQEDGSKSLVLNLEIFDLN